MSQARPGRTRRREREQRGGRSVPRRTIRSVRRVGSQDGHGRRLLRSSQADQRERRGIDGHGRFARLCSRDNSTASSNHKRPSSGQCASSAMAAANGSRPRYRRAWVDSEQNARIAASGSRRSRKIYRHRLRPICPIPRSMSHPVLPNTSPGRCAQSHHQAKLVAPVNVPEVEAATAEAPTPMQQQPKRVEQQDQQAHKHGHWSEQRQNTEWGRALQVCLRLAFDQYDASHQQLAPPATR